MSETPGATLRSLIESNAPTVVPGVFDGLSARMAVAAGFPALYMSGFSVAGATWGQPDIGLLTADEMVSAAARIVDVAGRVPVIADADNGYGGPLNVARTVRQYQQAGVACIQLEDQVSPKRCGHMEGKRVVTCEEAVEKITAAVEARSSDDFLIMARTDARATHDLDEALVRGERFLQAGADILFIEAPQSVEELRTISQRFAGVPLTINLVEDGKTPWPDASALAEMGYRIVLRPVTALLHLASNLEQTYLSMAAGDEPGSQRVTFGDFNERVGLHDANSLADRLRGKPTGDPH